MRLFMDEKLQTDVWVIQYWAIPEKIPTGGLKIYFLENPPGIFIFYYTPENSRQNKDQALDNSQNSDRSLENSIAKNKDPWKFHISFYWSPLEIPLHF